MTRRGLLATLAGMVGIMSGKATYGDEKPDAGAVARTGTLTFIEPSEPRSVTFSLSDFKDFTFTLGNRSVTFTAEQLMAELEAKDSSHG